MNAVWTKAVLEESILEEPRKLKFKFVATCGSKTLTKKLLNNNKQKKVKHPHIQL
jgi:hypothetical protein